MQAAQLKQAKEQQRQIEAGFAAAMKAEAASASAADAAGATP